MLKVENRPFGQAGKRIKHLCVEKNETVHCLCHSDIHCRKTGKQNPQDAQGRRPMRFIDKVSFWCEDSFERPLSEEILFPRALWKMMLKDKL